MIDLDLHKKVSGDQICLVIAVVLAAMMIYLIFPSLVTLILPDAEKTIRFLWKSPLTLTQSSILFGTTLFLVLGLNFVNHLRQVRAGGAIFPEWLVFIVVMLLSLSAIFLLFVFVFGVSASAFLSLGVESSIAIILALIIAFLAVTVN